MSELEDALTVRPAAAGWAAYADPKFESINAMFGGWTTAVSLRAVMESVGGDGQPSAITVNFIGPVTPGSDVTIATRRLGGSRSVSHWLAELTPTGADGAAAVATVVVSTRRESDGHAQAVMPAAADPDTLEEFHAPGTQGERTLIRPVVGIPPFGRMDTNSLHYVRDLTGRRVDRLQLAFLADQFAPRPYFWSNEPRSSATLTMTVYFHGTDEEIEAVGTDYILSEAVGSRGADSTSGQHARLWSRAGALLATSEQLAWYR
jgi:acyl-CoA thioesterase